jgi:hypothetical protein
MLNKYGWRTGTGFRWLRIVGGWIDVGNELSGCIRC